MRKTKLSEGSNLLWESSRMILPEHKARLQLHNKEQHLRQRPCWDEQQLALFSDQIYEALVKQQTVKVELFDAYEARFLVGEIIKVNGAEQTVQISYECGSYSFNINDLIAIEKVNG